MAIKKFQKPEDKARVESLGSNNNVQYLTLKRDFVPPVPEGSYVIMVFKVTGFGSDCDGSALPVLEQVDFDGRTTGWTENMVGLHGNTALIVDNPKELTKLVGS